MKRTLILALGLLLAGCQQKVQHDLDETQANEIEALLGEAGIEATKSREGGRDAKWAIAVPADRTAAAIRLLAEHALPRKRAPGFAEVFGKGSMVPTAVEESALFLHALSGELSQTLGSLEGVAQARVHLVTAPATPQPALRQAVKPRASVLLKARPSKAALLEARRVEIQALVAGSVEGLDPASVAVLVTELPALPSSIAQTGPESPARWPLLTAAALVALLATGLVLALLQTRRLRAALSAPAAPTAVDEATPSQPAAASPQRAA